MFASIVAYLQESFLLNPRWQGIGLLALGINALAFATSKDKKFLLLMAISSAIWWVHFQLLWLFAAAGTSFLDIIKNLLALKYPKNQLIFLLLLVGYAIIGYFTFHEMELFSLLPSINAILALIFVFYLKGKRLKIWFLFILILRFCYNRRGNSIGGMISDITLFFSWIYGLRQLHAKK